MNNETKATGKQVKVTAATHSKIYAISKVLRDKTGLRHTAEVIVANAVDLLEKRIGK